MVLWLGPFSEHLSPLCLLETVEQAFTEISGQFVNGFEGQAFGVFVCLCIVSEARCGLVDSIDDPSLVTSQLFVGPVQPVP